MTLERWNQLFEPSGLAGEVVSVVDGLTRSTSIAALVVVLSVLPAVSTDQ